MMETAVTAVTPVVHEVQRPTKRVFYADHGFHIIEFS